MTLDKLSSLMSRLCFFGAFVLLILAVIEKVANLSGYTIMRSYAPERLLEVAVMLMVFVIALLLRQVREQLRGSGSVPR
jgi:preprotein translocase subunit SecY